jgi:DNA-directed RNA polymerase subunit RPC12/RpoP
MAAWGLNCANCNQKLTKFAIEDNLESYFFPAKPDFPESGKEFECPNCGHKATYQRNDLVYMHR